MATLWDISGPLTLAAASGVLAYLAWRRRGLRPWDACRCGYRLAGNTSGVCPECGQPADEGRRATERARVGLALRRVFYWVLALGLAGVLAVGFSLRALGLRAYTDCRAVLTPRERLYAQVELTWRVEQAGEGAAPRARSVHAVLTGLDAGRAERDFPSGTLSPQVGAWVVGRCPTGSDAADEARELGEAVERALAGARVVLPGGIGSAHTLLAGGAVQTAEEPRWPTVLVLVLVVAGAAWGGRGVLRRALGRGAE